MTFNERISAALLGKKPIAYEQIFVDGTVAAVLNPPAQANPKNRICYAILILKAPSANAGQNHLLRFLETGNVPTLAVGMLAGDAWVYELQGYDQIEDFKMISALSDTSIQLEVNVAYYKLGDQ